MKVGDKLEWFLQLDREGNRQPILDQMPELGFFEMRYWNAFSFLSNRRQSGFGIGPISIESIRAWLDDNMVFDADTRTDYMKFICFIDNEYLKIKSDEQKNKPKAPPPSKR